jgi:hypothetical protein
VTKLKYCVIKNTAKVIDGSENPIEIMLQNAQNAGFSEDEVEILTEEEYLQRVEAEPKPPQPPTVEERIDATEQAILTLMEVLG